MKKKLGSSLCAVILAAGEGVRMRSETPKVLHTVAGIPMLVRVIRSVMSSGIQKICLVLGKSKGRIEDYLAANGLDKNITVVEQKSQRGSAHALMQADRFLKRTSARHCLVVCGDTPLIQPDTLQQFIAGHCAQGASATVLSSHVHNPFGYGRIVRNNAGEVRAIVEEKDASDEERKIGEINSGIYCFHIPELLESLKKIRPNNAKNEYYLTDSIHLIGRSARGRVSAWCTDVHAQIMGINNRVQLAQAERIARRQVCTRLMLSGVTIVDPETTYVDSDIPVGKDTILLPGVMVHGKSRIGAHCVIGPNSFLQDTTVEDEVHITSSYVYGSRIRHKTKIGPFAHVRPGSDIGPRVKIGNFVEVKKSRIKDGAKAGHLAYIGDARISEKANIGAGAVTCNYDGVRKHQTIIGKRAFIGTNVSMVAPISIGNGSFVAAGSTITENVPPKKLAIARARQVNKTRPKII